MFTINVRNVHQALPEGLRLLQEYGMIQDSRAGAVLVSPMPVMTIYEEPLERMLFWEERDANPFFHVMEALWMLSGRNDLEWLVRFNKRMATFSDNGRTLHGAYGHRWRNHFMWEDSPEPVDQLDIVVELLKRSPNSRRTVIQMFDCTTDLMVDESLCKDVPCNTQIYLSGRGRGEFIEEKWIGLPVQNRYLDMTVMCRSNDIIWGAYGANAVHFSILQEYLAARLGWRVGRLYQFSNNYHAYLDVFDKNKPLIPYSRSPYRTRTLCPYEAEEVKPYPLVSKVDNFDEELSLFMGFDEGRDVSYSNRFLNYAALVKRAYLLYKETNANQALEVLKDLPADWDVGVACYQWMERRLLKS